LILDRVLHHVDTVILEQRCPSGCAPERTSDNIGRIIAALLAAGMRVIVLSVSNGVARLRRPVADINKGARAVCRTGCTFVDLPLSGPDGLLFSAYSPDGTQLNAQGYKALAETIRPLL
jgi:hypothetical protein